jgi:catechol-2,3-dioxygenase
MVPDKIIGLAEIVLRSRDLERSLAFYVDDPDGNEVEVISPRAVNPPA